MGGDFPQMFQELSDIVKIFCKRNGYKYKVWNEKMSQNLINKYPQYKSMYNNVKYPIMRVDIIRFLILYHEGGLYLDFDIEPKIKKLKDYDWAVSVYNRKSPKYNMEAIQSKKGNQLNLDYLDYVKTQIKEKDKISIYNQWKIRYVLNTTGPRSLTRFIKENKIKPQTYKVNNSTTNPNSMNLEGGEEFLSYPSGSWIGK